MFVNILLPLIVGLLAGIILRRRPEKFKNFLVNFILYFIIPLFVFQVMWKAVLKGKILLVFSLAALCTVIVGIIVSLLLSTFLKEADFRDVALPVAFMNSGNLGIPAAAFIFGSAGIAYAVIFNAAIALLIFTAGVAIVSPRGGFKTVFRIPVIYALALGLVLNRWGPAFPSSVKAFETFQNSAMFLMLALVGWRLSFLKLSAVSYIAWISACRFGAGVLGAVLIIWMFDLPSLYAAPVAVLSLMPSAVNSYILTEKYNASATLASGGIALSTVIFLVFFSFLG